MNNSQSANVQLSLSAIVQGAIGTALMALVSMLWVTLSDLNESVHKLDTTLQLADSDIKVIDGRVSKIESEMDQRNLALNDWFSVLRQQTSEVAKQQYIVEFGDP